jgi:hypothetical protein
LVALQQLIKGAVFMLSLRSTAKLLDPTSQVISTKHLAKKVSLQPPISLKNLNERSLNQDNPSLSLLKGYKISTGFLGTDHTYVTSDNPSHAWPCWGRESGGTEICRGYGKYSVADCISQPNSWAGIIYGVTGVCHQTANRILYPARVTVSNAGGYWASHLAYGIYGTTSLEFFARVAICESLSTRALKSKASIESLDTEMRIQTSSIDDPEKAYLQRVGALYTEQIQTSLGFVSATMSEESSSIQKSKLESFSSVIKSEERYSLIGKELELMMGFRLGGNPDLQTTKSALKQQSDFLKEKGKMDGEFNSADFSIEKYVKGVNSLFEDLLISLPDILGKDEYQKIFDLPPLKEGFELINPDIAAEAYKQISKESIQFIV